jgi:ParB/RepB/Spo0J family partition protein
MHEVGFQGVLLVRPHGDPAKRRHGLLQLVYGHRRRAAWQRVCRERGDACLLPVVVREISDKRLLTIGAQENLQREDLDPVEEAQIVAWHERVFFDKNQAQIGAMLGKSSDWVSMRSRIHRLPDVLKERLRQRPRAISQILELGSFYMEQPAAAVTLADRVVQEQLTLDTVRILLRGYTRPERQSSTIVPPSVERRGATTIVSDITNAHDHPAVSAVHEEQQEPRGDATNVADDTESPLTPLQVGGTPPDALTRLQQAVAALSSVAAHADTLRFSAPTRQALDAAEDAILALRRSLLYRTFAKRREAQDALYRLSGTHIGEVLAALHCRQPVSLILRSAQTDGLAVHLLLCLLPSHTVGVRLPHTPPSLFIAVADAGNGSLPLTDAASPGWVQNHLRLPHKKATLVAMLLSDLADAERRWHTSTR